MNVSCLFVKAALNSPSFQAAMFGSERNATIMSVEPHQPALLGATPVLPLRSGVASDGAAGPLQRETAIEGSHCSSWGPQQQVAILPDSMSSYTSVLFPVERKKGTR